MILFKNVKWRNMLSTGNSPIEIKLDRSTTTLIVGENGAGKSTIIDAICFALFNKGFRNVSKTQLLNSINQKQLEVELDFVIGAKSYKVIRGIKPNKFEIYLNDIQVNQDADSRDFQTYLEDHILKLNYKSFTQIVILGSASFTPFMQLPQGHRREIIEDLLDIRIFSTMNVLLKDRTRLVNESVKALEGDILVQKERVRVQEEYITTLVNDQQKRSSDVQQRINTTLDEIAKHQVEIERIKGIIAELKTSIADQDAIMKQRKTLEGLYDKLVDKVKRIEEDIAFYNDHDNCPTCKQGLSHEIKDQAIGQDKTKLEEVQKGINEIRVQITTADTRIKEIMDVQEAIITHNAELSNFNTQIHGGQSYIQKLQDELNNSETDNSNIDEEKSKLRMLAKEVITLNTERTQLNEEKYYHDIAANLLKDTGIKTKVIKQYLPVINKLVNSYLSKMDFFVKFELDEAFNETIKSRHRDDFSYSSFSEGEKQRIDLALMLTFRAVAKLKNTCNTNLILMDEVFDSSLDHNGTDYLMNLLQSLGTDTNVFVISHKGDILFDKFRSVIKFEKHKDFSRIGA